MVTWRKSRVFSVVAIIATFVLLEVLLQILAYTFPKVNGLLFRTKMQSTIEDEKLGWRPNPKYTEHDRKGFRNKQVPDKADVVAMGDSQTYGIGVNQIEAWPQQLELLGRNTTYNMAFGGYGPAHSLILLQEAMELNPKLIIEAFYAGNDLYDSFSIVYERKQLPELRSSDPDMLKSVAALEDIEPFIERINRLFTMGNTERESTALKDFIAEHSAFYGLLRAVKSNYKYIFRKLPNKSIDWNSIENFANQKKEYCQVFDNGQFRTVFTPEYRLCALDLKDHRILEGLRISLEAIVKMNDHALHDKISFIVLLIPTKELVFKDIIWRDMVNIKKSYQDLVTNEELFWQRTKEYLQERGIVFIDGLQALKECLENGKQPYPISWDDHTNAIGHRAIAELVLSKIKEYRILEKSN